MYYYNKYSKSKIVHTCSCKCLKKHSINRLSFFCDIFTAEKNGYRICRCCAPLKVYFQREKQEIYEFCEKHAVIFQNHWSCFYINTYLSEWKIVYNDENKCIDLYHKNDFETGKETLIENYHLQNVQKNKVIDYLRYIVKHDSYRQKNPVQIYKKSTKPVKGTKRWRKIQKTKKFKRKKAAVKNVLDLIDNLSD